MTRAEEKEVIYYDGSCGFCHRWIKFVLSKDRDNHFDFAPRESEYFVSQIPEKVRDHLPRSILVRLESGEILTHSTATLYILKRLGGWFTFFSRIGHLFPCFLRDAGYKIIARIRHRIYASPEDLCPIVPQEYIHRFKK